jgi:glycosyltransferase involved in cell wall biosynthesis
MTPCKDEPMSTISPCPVYPYPYKAFWITRSGGRVHAIPRSLVRDIREDVGRLVPHPAILSGSTKEQVETLVDADAGAMSRPVRLGQYDNCDLYAYQGMVHSVPSGNAAIDLNCEEELWRRGVLRGSTVQEVRDRIEDARSAVPVEFAGWLPIFAFAGSCGNHPQFTHTVEPPAGYRFVCSAPARTTGMSAWHRLTHRFRVAVSAMARGAWLSCRPILGIGRALAGRDPLKRARTLLVVARLLCLLIRRGATLGAALRFLQTRHLQSQLQLPARPRLVFLTSIPFTYGQHPWVIEIEDPTTLFYPFIYNGRTGAVDISKESCLPIIGTMLESDQCRGILTHMRSTADMLRTLFKSPTIHKKIHYCPLGIRLPQRWQHHEENSDGDCINLLFTNSWHQMIGGFALRGGLEVLEAFAILHERHPQLRLTLRSELPGLDGYYHRLMESGWVRVIRRFLPVDEMQALLAESHIFLLPAARIHVVSLLQAMAHGLAIVTSDGWGIDEYIQDEHNGLMVRGRYGKVSWLDREAGMLREDYETMHTPDPVVVDGLVEAISRLVENRDLRKRLGRQARTDVRTKYNLQQWNQGLKTLFDQALAGESKEADSHRSNTNLAEGVSVNRPCGQGEVAAAG